MPIPNAERPPVTTGRATTAQRAYLTRLLTDVELIGGPMERNTRTGVDWRGLFVASGTPEPTATWPTVGAWIDTLSVTTASAVIAYLQNRVG